MTTQEAIATALAMFGATYDRKVTEVVADAWQLALGDLSGDDISRAAARALRECKFFPAPAEVRAFAVPARDLAHEGAVAWSEVRRAVDVHDYTVSSIDFGPVVNACVRQLGGWDALCRADLNDLNVWKRKEFERLYPMFAAHPPGDIGRALDGPQEGRVYGAAVVAIAGIPSQPGTHRALPPGDDEGVADLIRELAEEKSI